MQGKTQNNLCGILILVVVDKGVWDSLSAHLFYISEALNLYHPILFPLAACQYHFIFCFYGVMSSSLPLVL